MCWPSLLHPRCHFRGFAARLANGFATKLLVSGMLMSLLGCASSPAVRPPTAIKSVGAPVPASSPIVAVAPPPEDVAAPIQAVPTPVPITPPPVAEPPDLVPEGEMSVLVESEPHGATIVVNGIPVGKAPKKVMLPVTPQGFVRDTVSIKARFVAETSSQRSSTIEFELTPLDRMPSGLVFTPDRVVRKR